MNQYLIFRYASTVVRKMTAYQLCCARLARSPFVLTEHISSYNVEISVEVRKIVDQSISLNEHLLFSVLKCYLLIPTNINIKLLIKIASLICITYLA